MRITLCLRHILPLAAVLCLASPSPARADDWPQWLGPRRDAVWRESGILRQFPAQGPKVLWRAPIGPGYTGPAVAHGRVYVCDRVDGQSGANNEAAAPASSQERILCLEEATGKVVWQYACDCAYTMSYPGGPRATPSVSDGRVYTFGAQGRLCCLEAATGQLLWSRDLKKDHQAKTPIWGFAGHPLVDGQKVICMVGGENSLVVAVDKNTGQDLWHALQASELGYCPPMIYEAGGRRQLIIFHPAGLASLDPETGAPFWSQPYSTKVGLTVSTPRKMGDLLLVTSFYNGSMMMRLAADQPAATLAWQGKSASEMQTDGLHSIISTPFLHDGHIYGVCSYGQLRCLNAETGGRIWETLAATTASSRPVRWANAFLVRNGEVFFLANELGDLIIARLSPKGYAELGRAHLLEPTNRDCGRLVVWSHPAFANRCLIARNDREIIRVSLAE